MSITNRLLKLRLELGKALSGQTEVKTTEGKTLLFDGDQIVEGATINTINDSGAIEAVGSGTFTLEDGRVIVVEDSLVLSIKDKEEPVVAEQIPPVEPVLDSVVNSNPEVNIETLMTMVEALSVKVEELSTSISELKTKGEEQSKLVAKLSKTPLAIKMMKGEDVKVVKTNEITEESIKENPALRLFKE